MSRVVYSDQTDTIEQEQLRAAHGVRLVADAEEGMGVNALPPGVYGFTYSPGLPSAPLFATRRYRSYETHKTDAGEVFLVGYADVSTAAQVESVSTAITVTVQPEPSPNAATVVLIPYSRIHQHRQHAAPNQDGFTVTLAPSSK